MLADWGADVIKVEHPDGGDDTRRWGPPYLRDAGGNDTAESAYFLCANRGKASVCIDIRSEQGQAQLRALAADCDIVIENFRPGVADRLGVGYEDLAAENPGLIYALLGFRTSSQSQSGLFSCQHHLHTVD